MNDERKAGWGGLPRSGWTAGPPVAPLAVNAPIRQTIGAMKGKRQGNRRRLLLRAACIVFGVLVVAYVLAVPTGWLGDRTLLGHDGSQVDPGGATRRVLRVDGRKVECWVARSPGAADREPAAY